MEGLESVYAQAVYGMSRDNKIIDHQGSDLIWGGLINSCFMSDLEAIDEIQEHQEHQEQEQHFVVNRDVSIDPSSLDCSTEDDEGISALFSDSQTLWSFGGVSSAESENREIVNTETTMATKVKSLKRNREEETTRSHFSLVHNTQDDQQKGDFKLIYEDENQSRSSKKPRTEKERGGSSNISFKNPTSSLSDDSVEPDAEAIAQMKEMIYRAAAFRPVNFGLEVVEKPKRKNVKISTDPQTVAARQRRERISEKIRVLQTLVPGGTKMDTASMLDEAANYLKFLRAQVKALENLRPKFDPNNISFSSAYASSFPVFHPSFVPLQNPNQVHNYQC